ncbi:tRNA preQ1(34) S-adenosylmethionine ribosyltransferase-isomerase QueA [Carboxydochorda subterranea]|uniref:S-adenosylmethionine:tRNA ribosyltransferase-isomerase n=1 Tax=Carboxydichorda subterranea TaxID=3109565 RepID=A0ABZ1C1F2_9FIRM|nr:tRNA preQ1(34) S-adenosylmethionine ribosyltransferase-isomerase QueA [Limnochorda sp. L945t]WRP18912.1 tRNA preQ1(34) S-adenosylmethionine ribosyltransferase-isomerase QueA [Limnochorda sp. L945t]
METSRFSYELPPALIAQRAAEPRDASRLLVLHGDGRTEHRVFRDVIEYLRPGDLLVVNDTRVMKARLFARRRPQGGRVELLLLRRAGGGPAGGPPTAPDRVERWHVLVKPGRRAPVGQWLEAGDGRLGVRVVERTGEGGRVVELSSQTQPVDTLLDELGALPLPPYIRVPLDDPERYQTVYARVAGSAAAPTAGLHFTPELLEKIRRAGVRIEPLTLHVGVGTFRPVRSERVEEHVMHEEFFTIPEETAEAILRTHEAGGRVWAVGTTVVRALESAAVGSHRVQAGPASTRLFIYPPYAFKVVDVLITNFHLPRSTLLMLVCAFGGTERVLAAYREAVALGYRFYSFGDAMLILP